MGPGPGAEYSPRSGVHALPVPFLSAAAAPLGPPAGRPSSNLTAPIQQKDRGIRGHRPPVLGLQPTSVRHRSSISVLARRLATRNPGNPLSVSRLPSAPLLTPRAVPRSLLPRQPTRAISSASRESPTLGPGSRSRSRPRLSARSLVTPLQPGGGSPQSPTAPAFGCRPLRTSGSPGRLYFVRILAAERGALRLCGHHLALRSHAPST